MDDLIKDGGNVNINGVSLLVFFDDGNPDNDIASSLLFADNDSNIESIYDPQGWNAFFPSINYEGGPASLQLHVGDGQVWVDDDLRLNGQIMAAGPQIFDGSSVPGGGGPGGNGSLWDIRSFDIAAFLTGGANDLNLTTGVNDDCLSLVAVTVVIGAPDIGPQVVEFGSPTQAPPGPDLGAVYP